MKIKSLLLIVTNTLIISVALTFSVFLYKTHKRTLLEGIDKKLLTAAYCIEEILPRNYHDKIISKVSMDEYLEIVDRYNKFCTKLGLQYVWTLMIADNEGDENNQIVFTSATSTEKDISKSDFAMFFDVHSNPAVYKQAFSTMNIQYTTFHDQWGDGRMVLVPKHDGRGRSYLLASSMNINDIKTMLHKTMVNAFIINALVLFAGLVLSFISSSFLTKPIIRLTKVAEDIARGNLDHKIEMQGSLELRMLSKSIEAMAGSIHKKIKEIKNKNTELIKEIEDRKIIEETLRKSEEKNRLLNRELELRVRQRTLQLEETGKELEDFAYSVSHDLRAPLRSITGFAEIIQRRHKASLNEEGRHYLDNVIKAGRQMGTLIDDLLRFSRLGRKAVKLETIPLDDIFKTTLATLSDQIKKTNARITLPEHMPFIQGDLKLTVHIFNNILENALKYRKPDELPMIDVRCDTEDDYVVVSIADNGIGIEKEYQEKIFNIFQRLHSQEDYPGTGIGLAAVRKVLQIMDGKVWVESEPGMGSVFKVKFLAGTVSLKMRYKIKYLKWIKKCQKNFVYIEQQLFLSFLSLSLYPVPPLLKSSM